MKWHTMTERQVLDTLQVDRKTGLSRMEADRRRRQVGENRLQEKKHTSIWIKFLEQWKDFMILTLIGAAVISTVVSFLNGERDLTDPIIIFVIITVNAVLGVVQETKAEKSLESLKRLSAPSAMVLRDGRKQKIDAVQVVPGDIVYLETGSYVPADGRLLEVVDLKVEESALTGESLSVEKKANIQLAENTPVSERINVVLSTTVITGGRGTMVVTETGMNTEVGCIARMIIDDEKKETPLQERLAQTSKILGLLALMICVVMFFVGLYKDHPLFEMFMTSVSLAVAAIPEGLPAIVTILLSQGVQRMVQKNAIVRKLPAVETLGCATVICSDKTGTLTQNRMSVTEIASVCGRESMTGEFAKQVLTCAVLCSNVTLRRDGKKGRKEKTYSLIGEPTEKALVEAAIQSGLYKDDLDQRYPRLSEVPFDSAAKRMTTVHRFGETRVQIVKGAPDVLVGQSDHVLIHGRKEAVSIEYKEKILYQNELMAKEGLRVIAVGRTYEDTGLCFLGLIGMIDPPRPEVREAVHTCRMAGIRPVMITGDHPITGSAIARQLGILGADSDVLTGQQLERMSQSELIRAAGNVSVYARVSPEHKVRIVKALQSSSHVVAMTGDGVNDAPALKAADIGCAMGKSGTDVAKNSADMILTDDNFATIVAAVKEGRVIYDNIRKTIHFLLSSNIGEILTIFSAIIMGYPSPLLPVQLLWMNLVTDSLPAIALGSEPADQDVMERPPIAREKGMLSDGLAIQMCLEGVVIGLLALISYLLANHLYGLEMARTMTFSVLSLSQLFHVFNIRSTRSLFRIGWFSNTKLLAAFMICLVLQIGVVMLPTISHIFRVQAMDWIQWSIVIGLSMVPIPVMEIQKRINSRIERREMKK